MRLMLRYPTFMWHGFVTQPHVVKPVATSTRGSHVLYNPVPSTFNLKCNSGNETIPNPLSFGNVPSFVVYDL